jgi:hypothetical protein
MVAWCFCVLVFVGRNREDLVRWAADEVGRVKEVVVVGRRAAEIVVILVKEFVDRGESLRGFEFVVGAVEIKG